MSYTEEDAWLDELYDRIEDELYPDHKEQAIEEFVEERLVSFYKKNPDVMRPAVDAIQEGNRLVKNNHFAAAVVFYTSAVELLLKATTLRPIIYGLIHNEKLADAVVDSLFVQSGFKRYENLLSKIFYELTDSKLSDIRRESSEKKLLIECEELQMKRNKIIHQGLVSFKDDAELSRQVAVAVFEEIVRPVISSIGLSVGEKGRIT